MKRTYFLGIDIGTYESKGVLVDADGVIQATASRPHPLSTPRPGFAEHDANEAWWGDFCHLSRQLLADDTIDPRAVKAVGVSTIAPCCLAVDSRGDPLRPAILYGVDVRAAEEIDELNRQLGAEAVLRKTGNPITSQSVGPKILWLKKNEPEVWRRTARFVTGTTWLVARLTGQWVVDHYTAAYFTPLYTLDKADWDDDFLPMFCRRDQLAECRWTDEIAGFVTPDAARATGLAAGTPVVTGTADAAAEAVGVGIFDPGDLLLMFGSSIYMIHVVDQLRTDARLWAGPYLQRGRWMVAAGMSTAGTLTRWFRDQLARDVLDKAEQSGGNAYDLLMQDIEGIPPGSDGLVVLPYLSGERTPIHDPKARGAFFGLTLGHRREHLYRACLEGVGYGIAQHLEIFDQMGLETNRIVAVGGGTRNPSWLQLTADICGRTLSSGQAFGAAYGDALLAALGSGHFADVEDLRHRIQLGPSYQPDPERHRRYQPYTRIYQALYQQTKNLMSDLNQL